MRLLLDTHALLWWFFNDPKLSRQAKKAIADMNHTVLVSSASAWEIATKHRLGRLPEAGDVTQRLGFYLQKAQFSVLEITIEHALVAGRLPGPHKDPFDRMLIAQAQVEKIPIVTVDAVFPNYGIPVIW